MIVEDSENREYGRARNDSAAGLCVLYVDMGTTNTRVWLASDNGVHARAQAGVGVRDTAHDGGDSSRVRQALSALLAEMVARACDLPGATCTAPPRCVIAAGMITSPLGLAEVPHVAAPAGLAELAAHVEQHRFPDVTELPVLLVPGVRSGPAECDPRTVGTVDVMRGEETLCVGLTELGLLQPEGMLLNLGSHWKAINLDGSSRVASSVTSMSGELVHTAQTQTILASAVPPERPTVIDEAYLEAGMWEQRRSGLARALFCVRLLEQRNDSSTPEERLSFLIGAFIAADLDALLARRLLTADAARSVVITGSGAVVAAWAYALKQASIHSVALTPAQVEHALLIGLRRIAAASLSALV